jgi:hypothetical protein
MGRKVHGSEGFSAFLAKRQITFFHGRHTFQVTVRLLNYELRGASRLPLGEVTGKAVRRDLVKHASRESHPVTDESAIDPTLGRVRGPQLG